MSAFQSFSIPAAFGYLIDLKPKVILSAVWSPTDPRLMINDLFGDLPLIRSQNDPGLEINQTFPFSWRHLPSTSEYSSEWLPKVYGRFSPSSSDYSIQTKMAAAEVIRWSTVVGEYGVLLTEMGSMEDLQTPIKPYPRIKVCGVMLYNRIYLFA